MAGCLRSGQLIYIPERKNTSDLSDTPMKSSKALALNGVGPDLLSADEWNFLDENGYLLLDGILRDDELIYLRKRLEELAEIEGENAGSELHRE